MPTLYKYQVDASGDYVLNGGNKIVLNSYPFASSGWNYRRLSSTVKRPAYIRSFKIQKFNDGTTWTLVVNQKQLIGIYPTQDACLEILVGLVTSSGGAESGAYESLSRQLSLGRSSISDAFNNLSLAVSGDDLVITLANIDTTGLATATVEYDDYTTPGTPGALTLVGAVTEPEGGTQIFTVVNGYAGVPENSYIQAFFTDFGVSTEASSNVLLKDDVAPTGFSVKVGTIGDEDAVPTATTDGVTYTGAAYAYPQWVSNDWPVGVTPSYSYAWTYTIDAQAPVAVGGSGSTLNLALVPYGATLTCGAVATAYVNGKIATSTDPATQVAVAVTQTNIEVADIKLFLTADPNGTEQTVIQPSTTYFAYPYNASGNLLTDPDTTWVFPGQLVAPSNVAFTLSGTEAVGETITASAVTYDGGTSTLVYSWNGTGPTTDQTTYLLDAGDEGNTVTLTVTATNNGGTADGTAATGVIGPFVPTADWDTEPISYFYSNGVTGSIPVNYIFNTSAWDTLQAAGNPAPPETTTTSGASMRMANTVSGGWNSDAVATAFPHAYIWNTKYGSNNGWDKVTQTTAGNFKPSIDFSGDNHAYAFDDNTPECVYAFYATDQGDISGWRAYDGPTA